MSAVTTSRSSPRYWAFTLALLLIALIPASWAASVVGSFFGDTVERPVLNLYGFIFVGLAAFIPAKVAADKGHDAIRWWLYGFALWIVAMLHAGLVLHPTSTTLDLAQANDGRHPCPHCAEWIRPEAKVCRHCGREVTAHS